MNKRNCVQTIEKILTYVPYEESNLRKALLHNRETAFYAAPENILSWESVFDTLLFHIYPPKKEWHFEVWSVFSTKSVEELKQLRDETT
jgi:hypothetical protein